MTAKEYLAEHWAALMSTVKPDKACADTCFNNISSLYSGAGRYYHTLDHIAALMKQADTLKFDDPVSVKLAIFYHDFIYGQASKHAGSNEEQSARAAISHLKSLGFDKKVIDRVAQLIRLTERHKTDPADRDAALFLDMDMSIIGVRPDAYKIYAWQVRQEYSQYNDQLFCMGRLDFLQTTLSSGKSLFITDLYEDKYGRQAKANIMAERHHIKTYNTPYGVPIGSALKPSPA